MSARRPFRILGKTKPVGDPLPAVAGMVQAIGALQVLDALPHPILTVDEGGYIETANAAAEEFFSTSLNAPRKQTLARAAAGRLGRCSRWSTRSASRAGRSTNIASTSACRGSPPSGSSTSSSRR